MSCRYRVSFTRKGKRLKTTVTFRKKSRANAYKDSLNKNLTGAKARVVKDTKRRKK